MGSLFFCNERRHVDGYVVALLHGQDDRQDGWTFPGWTTRLPQVSDSIIVRIDNLLHHDEQR